MFRGRWGPYAAPSRFDCQLDSQLERGRRLDSVGAGAPRPTDSERNFIRSHAYAGSRFPRSLVRRAVAGANTKLHYVAKRHGLFVLLWFLLATGP